MTRLNLSEKNTCCGCAACMNTCPKQAIQMKEDSCGFVYPNIDDSKCINCGLCSKICDFKKEHDKSSNIEKAYSLTVNDSKILYESTSGGAFTVFSDYILDAGGVVVGSVMEQDFLVHHVWTKDESVRNRMRGSKYVQSDISEIFKPIKNFLDDGIPVLFSGTPCQCAAIKSYLRKDYENFYVVDFLCHGVPSNHLFKEHIQFLENHFSKKITHYTFRDKVFGWNSYNNNIYMGSTRKSGLINQIYYNFFVSNYSLRPSCYNCVYRSLNRPADITVADFWGIEKITGKKNHEGVSLVLQHSLKGATLLQNISEKDAEIREVPVKDILYRVSTRPIKIPQKLDLFWPTYKKEGYKGLVSKFFNYSMWNRIHYEIRKFIKKYRLH